MSRIYISDIIGNEYMNWRMGDIIYITAPTGSGKTSFILNILMPYAKKLCRKILYIVNRQSLRLQLKTDLARKLSIEYGNQEELDKIMKFDNLTVITYQYMEKIIDIKANKSLYDIGVKKEFEYVVFDEAHYFVEDSMFNPFTDEVYKAQKFHFSHVIRIFISATLNDFISYDNSQSKTFNILPSIPQKWVYDLKPDYSDYNITYFKDFKSICNKINEDKTDYKWLIFVSSKDVAKEIKKELNVNSHIITAETKENYDSEEGQVFYQIVKDQKFESKVIIATSVIDCGINLHDELLKNIVISTFIYAQFMQMLGRKRKDSNKSVNLYIDAKSLQQINAYKTYVINKMIEFYYLFRESKEKALIKILEDKDTYHLCHKIIRFRNNQLIINKIAVYKMFKMNEFCKRIIESFRNEGESAFIKEQLSWLGLENTYNETNWIDYSDKKSVEFEIMSYLEKKVDLMLNKAMQDELRTYITFQFKKIYGRNDIDRISKNLGIVKINKILKKYSYGYNINSVNEKRMTYWVVCKS